MLASSLPVPRASLAVAVVLALLSVPGLAREPLRTSLEPEPGEGWIAAAVGATLKLWSEAWAGLERHRTGPVEMALGASVLDPRVDRFALVGCTLGCGPIGPSMTCSVTNLPVNPQLGFDFTRPVSLGFLLSNPSAVRIFDVTTGQAVPGTFSLDPTTFNTLRFDPDLAFDPQGNPIFALTAFGTYQIQIAGVVGGGGGGPFLQSINGAPLANSLLCSFTADQGVFDYVPGAPMAFLELNGAQSVPVDTDIRLSFDDVMNIATVVVPGTGQAPFMQVSSGSTVISGTWQFGVSTVGKSTSVTFLPDQSLPPNAAIDVTFQPAIADLVGNPLSNPGSLGFTTGS